MSLLLLQSSTLSLLIPLFLFVISLFLWLSTNYSSSKKNIPPSPPKLPVLGNLLQLGLYPHRNLQSMARKYGPFMLLHLGSKPALIVSSAEAAREIMKTHDVTFANRPNSRIPTRLLYDKKDVAYSPYGEYWRQVRSICVLQLLSNKRVQSFGKVRDEEVACLIHKIRDSSSSFSSAINISEMLLSLTIDILSRVALGKKYSGGEGEKKFRKLLGDFTELLGSFDVGEYIPWLSWVNRFNGLNAKLEKCFKGFDDFIEGIVEEHMVRREKRDTAEDGGEIVNADAEDFVDILLDIQTNNTTGFSFQRDTVKALILDMFTAGTDTSYAVLEWAMTELVRHPETLKKLQKEVREAANGQSSVTEEDLEKMLYLKAVIKEAMRLHAPLPLLIPRASSQDVKVKGYDIAAGTMVLINAWGIGRDPWFWEEAESFRPERFLNSTIDYKGFDFEFIPFGAGRRGCPGLSFGVAVTQITLANLVHKFDFGLPKGMVPEDVDMTEAVGIAAHKSHPLFVTATPCYR